MLQGTHHQVIRQARDSDVERPLTPGVITAATERNSERADTVDRAPQSSLPAVHALLTSVGAALTLPGNNLLVSSRYDKRHPEFEAAGIAVLTGACALYAAGLGLFACNTRRAPRTPVVVTAVLSAASLAVAAAGLTYNQVGHSTAHRAMERNGELALSAGVAGQMAAVAAMLHHGERFLGTVGWLGRSTTRACAGAALAIVGAAGASAFTNLGTRGLYLHEANERMAFDAMTIVCLWAATAGVAMLVSQAARA